LLHGAGRLLTNRLFVISWENSFCRSKTCLCYACHINPNSADFAGDDVINTTTGLDVVKTPSQVIPISAGVYYNSFTAKFYRK
jgi:hypothetical protein